MSLNFHKNRTNPWTPSASPRDVADSENTIEETSFPERAFETKRGRRFVAPLLLLVAVLTIGAALTLWKQRSALATAAASASQPEPMEFVTTASATPHLHSPTATAIGTVLARRSITLRNELSGTVRQVSLTPGQIVGAGSVLVRLDVSVEQAELEALRAQAALAQTLLDRYQQAAQNHAVSEHEVDRARAERDVALAQIARLEAVIERKTIRAPFRARIGLADVHAGQYLDEGTELTTLQGIDSVAHVDFSVAQDVAAGLRQGDVVEVLAGASDQVIDGVIVAIDARVDRATRNAMVRARIDGSEAGPAPGASVRVRVPSGPPQSGVVIPVSALRTGPDGDHVFVITPDESGSARARQRSVSVGAVLGDQVIVDAGLAKGERVAAAGSFKLREAVLVAFETEGTASVAAGSK